MSQRILHASARLVRIGFVALCCAALLAACGDNMRNDSRLKPYEASPVFADNQSMRPIDPNTVPREESANLQLTSGKANGAVVTQFPITISRDTLVAGQKGYSVFCTPCHGANADGKGLISPYFTAAKANPPANLLDTRLRGLPVGHYFDVISNGLGAMYSYGSRIDPVQRWEIIAYIRALQANKDAPLDVPPDQIQQTGAAAGGTAR